MIVRCSSLLYVPDMLKNLPPFDAVIYIGDLNYRLDVSRDKASSHVFDDELTIVDLFQLIYFHLSGHASQYSEGERTIWTRGLEFKSFFTRHLGPK